MHAGGAGHWPPRPQAVARAVNHGGSRPMGVQCPAARILRGSTHYVVVVHCEDGRRWAVAKRFSHFDNFRKLISPVLARLAPGTDQLPFPPKTPFRSGTSSQTVELRMEMFEQWLGAIIDIVTDEHIAESVVDGRTLIDEAALAEQKLCIFLAEDESVDVEILQSLGLEARSSMLTEQAMKDRAGYTAPREMPTIMRRQRPALSAGGSHGGGLGNGMALLGILDDDSGYDDDTGPSPRGGVWKEHEPLPLQSWGVEPPPHLAATRKLQGRTLSGRTPPASPAHQHGAGREEEYGHGTFVLKNPDRASSNDSDPGLIGPGHGGEPDELVEGDGVEVSVTFGVGKIGIQYRLAQASSTRDATVTSGRCEVLVIEKLVPGGLAVMCSAPHLQPGDILTKVNGESVKGQRYEHIMRWMREAPRPLKLGFETPLSPAARITAAIKARTAAALAAATAAPAGPAEEAVAKEGNPEAEDGDLFYGGARTTPDSPLMTLAREEAGALIARLKEQREHDGDSGEVSLSLSPSANDSLGSEDGGSEVGSGDGNLSSTPDSAGSQDANMFASCEQTYCNGNNGMVSMSAGADDTDDGQGQVHLRRPSSPAATPNRPARPSRTRGLKGLNGSLTPRRSSASELAEPAEAVDIDESVEIGLDVEGRSTQRSLQEKAVHKEQICVSFSNEGPIGLELTVSVQYRQQRQAAVVVRAIRPGTQATAHVPPLRAGLVLMYVGAVDVRGLSLDEVYAAIVDHEQRPLIVTFLDPPARHEHLWVQHQGENEGEWERSLSPEVVSEPAADVEDDVHRSVREYLAGKGMEACTGGVCRALSEHGTEPSQWLSTLTGMASATQRDLLEAVRAQYARESPLRSLAWRTAGTIAASAPPAMSGDVSSFNAEGGGEVRGHESGVVGLNESVEQAQGLAVAELAESENERKAIHGAL